ncbi:MAG: Gfo/Idh/MocA family oxidoreductase [Oscillospiraceae bacterium]|jgi:predicted dehydrogenase|nr:Gfo/Idh/MocA family oxidoreductase [Oscillospiraceae bacterium]
MIQVGIVGSGFAARLHLDAYRFVPGVSFRVASICSKDATLPEFAREYEIERVYTEYEEMLRDAQIDVVDIITPPRLHSAMILQALAAGKHVICEKPLTGFCKPAFDEQGNPVSRSDMLAQVNADLDAMEQAMHASGKRIMYAENAVYASAVQKQAEFLRARKSRVLLITGEQAHNGSQAAHAALWRENGGGALIRQGCHPLSAALYLKRVEGEARGEIIRPVAIMADVGVLARPLESAEHVYIESNPVDVEDWATICVEFSDGSRAQIWAGDMALGGVRNRMELFTGDGYYALNMAPNNMMDVYHPDERALQDVYITEKVSNRAGWQHVLLEEAILRGYVGELTDFLRCARDDYSAPQADFTLARDCVQLIYAGYVAAERGVRVLL